MNKLKINFRTRRCVARANAVTRFIHMRDVYFFYVHKQFNFVSSKSREKTSVTISEKIINHLAKRENTTYWSIVWRLAINHTAQRKILLKFWEERLNLSSIRSSIIYQIIYLSDYSIIILYVIFLWQYLCYLYFAQWRIFFLISMMNFIKIYWR